MDKDNMKLIKYYILPLLIFILFFTFYKFSSPKIPIRYWDEQGWIGSSYFFELLINRDFKNELWNTWYSYGEPKLTSYLYGLVLYPKYLQFKHQLKDSTYDFSKYLIDNNFFANKITKYINYKEGKKDFIEWGKKPFEDFNVSTRYLLKKYGEGFQKTIDIIITVRKINVILLALSVVITYFLISSLFDTKTAILTSLLYGFNNLIIKSGLVAHSEALFILLFNLSLFILINIIIYHHFDVKNLILFSLVLALLIQTKTNGVIILLIFYILILIKIITLLFMNNYKQIFFLIIYTTNLSLILFVFFVMLHPYLYPNPIQNTINIYNTRLIAAYDQANAFPQDYISNPPQRFSQIYNNFFGYKEFRNFNTIFINIYLKYKIKLFIFYLNLIVFLLGIVALIIKIIISKKNDNYVYFLIIFSVIQLLMSVFQNLKIDRFYVQLVIFFEVFRSFGIINCIYFLKYLSKKLYFVKHLIKV